MSEQLCREVVISVIAGASWIPCALPKGHEGGHRGKGNCCKHGEYLGEVGAIPQCPKWPDCVAYDSIKELMVKREGGDALAATRESSYEPPVPVTDYSHLTDERMQDCIATFFDENPDVKVMYHTLAVFGDACVQSFREQGLQHLRGDIAKLPEEQAESPDVRKLTIAEILEFARTWDPRSNPQSLGEFIVSKLEEMLKGEGNG